MIDANVRVFTLSDFAIIGKGASTVINFEKFGMLWRNLHQHDLYKNGVNCIALIASPWEIENISGYNRDNSFVLKNFSVQVSGGIWFPCIPSDTDEESELGVLLSFANFHNAEVTGVSVIAKDNGELTLMDTNECDHQKITDCYFYLNNWFDRTTGTWSKQNPEQGANLNIRGNHKSVHIARNTFVKHGNDEALTFLEGSSNADNKFVHENIRVVQNTFTYLDAEIEDVTEPDNPAEPDEPVTPEIPTEPGSPDTKSNRTSDTDDNRPVHINGVLISFAPTLNSQYKSEWKNVLFANNTLYLQGPVNTAVSMALNRDDKCSGVVFANNTLYHTYRHNGKMPGNCQDGITSGALPYRYSASFNFGMNVNAEGEWTDSAADDTSVDQPVEKVEEPNTASFYGNTIYYSQHTQDKHLSDKNDEFVLAYEHSCFRICGVTADIHDNFIDGTQAVVIRHPGSHGQYGKTENPVSLLHCVPCKKTDSNSVRFCNNEAVGYGLVLRCRDQFLFRDEVHNMKNNSIYIEGNSLFDGAAMALFDMVNCQVNVSQNRFSACTESFMFQGNRLRKTDIKICQNLFDSNKALSDYQGKLFANGDFINGELANLFILSNCLIGYTATSLNLNEAKRGVVYPAIRWLFCKEANMIVSKVPNATDYIPD